MDVSSIWAFHVLLLMFVKNVSGQVEEIIYKDIITLTEEAGLADQVFPLLRIEVGDTFVNDEQSVDGKKIANYRAKFINTYFDNLKNQMYKERFKSKEQTVVFIVGFLDNPGFANNNPVLNSSSVRMYGAYYLREQQRNKQLFNFINVNWSAYNKGEYHHVIHKMKSIAERIGDHLFNLAFNDSNPVDLRKWHLIGVSLGAHMAGLIARRVKERTNGAFKMPRVTALDPAGPLVNYPLISLFFPHLKKTDAEFIDAIHTDPKVYGSSWSVGHVDFWTNYEEGNQPGCPKNSFFDIVFRQNTCNHERALWLYAESVWISVWQESNGYKPFPAVRCDKNWFNQLSCTKEIAYMGFNATKTAVHGDYYLKTGSERLYLNRKEDAKYYDLNLYYNKASGLVLWDNSLKRGIGPYLNRTPTFGPEMSFQ